jgi:hypothetical protein
MVFFIFQLLVVLSLGLVLLTFSRNRYYRLVTASLISLGIVLEISSIYMGDSLIDYKFFEHFNFRDLGLTFHLFIPQLLLAVLILLTLAWGLLRASRFFDTKKWFKPRYSWVIGLALIGLLCLKNGVVYNLYAVNQLQFVDKQSFEEALEKLGIPAAEYVSPEDLKAEAGKNIIVLSLESYERSFLADNLAYLTPNLRGMKEEMEYLPMEQVAGSDWTSASLYTFLTGVPMFFQGERDEIFRQAQSIQLSSLSHVLQTAGYQQTYLMGKPEFGGTDEMLQLFGIDLKSENDFDTLYQEIAWGLHDFDLFQEIKKAAHRQHQGTKPFAIYASTISTHGPDGIYDKRLEQWLEPEDTNLEFMAKGLDYLIGDLVDFLKQEGIMDNTVIYIFPDHLLKGYTISVSDRFEAPRGLFVLTNAAEKDLAVDPNTEMLQIDLPKLMLAGAQVKHNARFLGEFIPGDRKTFLNEHREELLVLNEAAMASHSFEGDILVELTIGGDLLLSSGATELRIEGLDSRGKRSVRIDFDDRMRATTSIRSTYSNLILPAEGKNLLISNADKRLTAFLRMGKETVSFKQGLGRLRFSRQEIEQLKVLPGFLKKVVGPFPPFPDYERLDDNDLVRITSTTYGEQSLLTPSQIHTGTKVQRISRGVNLLTRKNGSYRVQTFDTHSDAERARILVEQLKTLKEQKQFHVLVVDVTVGKTLRPYQEQLQSLGFFKLPHLSIKEAYIAYADRGFVTENQAPRSLSISFPYHPRKKVRTDKQVEADARDPNRFIAHAGGKIQGEIYTNSLEALDQSYEQGFRLFELDIIKTKDGHFVAAHDWASWRRKTGYKLKVPTSLSDFKRYKIKGKFTPMDMEAINDWFSRHEDAILVTDKINQPKEFAEQFVDKNRLMMELFSLDAVEEGLEIGLKGTIPSMNVFTAIKGDKVAFLKDLGVEYLAVSIDLIYQNLPLFEALKANGIKTYIFHVNSTPWKDEKHVVRQEMDYIYGLYADVWSFEDQGD